MNIRDTFRDTKIAYIPAEEDSQKQQKAIKSQASYYGIKLKITTGLFVNPTDCETIKLLKIELIGELPKKIRNLPADNYRENELLAEFESLKRTRKIMTESETKKLIDMFLSGMTYQQIADSIGVTKQAVYSRIATRVRKLKRED